MVDIDIDKYIVALLDEPFKKSLANIDQYDERLTKFQEERPTELSGFKQHMSKLTNFKLALDSLKFNLSLDVVLAAITDELIKSQERWLQSKEDAYAKIDEDIDALKNEIETANRKHNEHLKNQNREDNISFETLEAKRNILMGYSDKIINVCNQYGVTSSDISIDENTLSSEELSNLYDEYIKYMQKESNGTNVISKFRSICKEQYVQGVVLLVLIFLCFTSILDFVSIAFFILLAVNQIQNINKAKYYSVLMAITFNINPENMGYTELDSSLLLPEELTPEMLDADPRFAKFEEMYNQVEVDTDDENPDLQNTRVMSEWANKLPANIDKIKEYEHVYTQKIYRLTSDVVAEIAYMKKQYDKLKSEFKFLGSRFSEHLTFNSKFVFGLHDDCIEEVVDIGFRNVIIRPSVDSTLMDKFLQCMYVNAISNVLPGKMMVTVYDPNNFGRSIMPLYKDTVKEYLEFYNDGLNEIIDNMVTYVQNNFKEMGGKSIQEYNQHCEEMGITPIQYKLIMVLSQPKTIEEDEKLQNLFEYSATGGVFIWMISDSMQSKNAFVFRAPFEGVPNPISKTITDDWCKDVLENYTQAISNAKPKGLDWVEFMDNVWPWEKAWTGDTSRYCDFYTGYLEGDPTSYKPYSVGNDGNVHAVCAGTSGAGKSVFLNHLIVSCCTIYSPKDLEFWLADFKGTEFITYMKQPDRPYALPHVAACLCTSDGAYATSLFKAFRNKADARYDDMKYIGVKNLPGWNAKVKSLIGQRKPDGLIELRKKTPGFSETWSEADLWPRVVFICDEFQVIFQKAGPENVELIKADITQIAKVARACGMHIFFTSQSMKGTVSSDILANFTLRFCLRCEPEVSRDILGSTRASDIKEKAGYIIVKDYSMKSAEDQKRYKTPFLNDDVGSGKETQSQLFDRIKKIYDLGVEKGIADRAVITYEEATKHPIQELVDLYKKLNESNKLPNSGTFFLGPRMSYSENKAPDNIVITPKNNTNIMYCGTDYTDYVMYFNQLITNINCNKKPGSIFINSQVDDLAYYTDAEKYITNPEKYGKLLSSKFTCKEMVTWMKQLFDARKANNKKEVPVWIFLLGWDKGRGFGIEADSALRVQLNNVLQMCGEYNMHVIFMNSCMTGIPASTVGACNYLIASKCSENDSNLLLGKKLASLVYTLETGWVFVKRDGEITRDKIYQSELPHEILSTEVVL